MSKIIYIFKTYTRRLVLFGRTSDIHGLRHIARHNAQMHTRLFWMLVLSTSIWCTYKLLLPVLLRGPEVSFTPESSYLRWTSTFPAVTVCEKYIHAKTLPRFMELYPDLLNHLDFTRRKYLSDILYAKGSCRRCEECGSKIPCDLRWRDIANEVRRNCKEMLSNCTYNGISFPCCDRFVLVDSEEGPCYSLNTLQSPKTSRVSQYVVNITTGPGVLAFSPLVDLKVSVHSSEELSTNALDPRFTFVVTNTQVTDFIFSMAEMENDPLLEMEDIAVRGCRYLHEIPEEPFLKAYPVYSFGACNLARRTKLRFDHCGCVHPVRDMAYEKLFCNFTGLNCLAEYEAHITKLSGPTGSEDPGVLESCLPSCEESELTQVHATSREIRQGSEDDGPRVVIHMTSLPTLRYRRSMLRNDLDLVVTVGGILGVFFGASLLSIVEILYLLLRK